MYAIVEIAGQQFKVEKDQKLFVHRLESKEGSKVTFDNVLLLANGDKISVGAPAIDGAQVGVKVLKHFKGNKVIVFKKKRRKGYKVKNGHRQFLTEIMVEKILEKGAKPVADAKSEVQESKPAAKKPAAKKPAAKKPAAKRPAAKKPAAKKSAAKKPAAKKTTKKA
jgi:large subunit ribosomal protein L21